MARTALWASALGIPIASIVLVPLCARSQGPGRGAPSAASTAAPFANEVKTETREGYRYITSNGIPDHPVGQFPNSGNPNRIAPQSYQYRVSLNPKIAERETPSRLFGVAVNGVPFDPGTAELWNGDLRWHYEALSGVLFSRGGLGVDDNLAHVQPNGAYHYHGLPMGLLKKLDYKNRMALVGYAADGFPIYGPYAYSDPNDAKSPLKMLTAGYRIREGNRPGGTEGPGGAYDGSFAQDYEFVKGGDLDTCNGRVGVTPEYPKGTYYYVLTSNWPFVPRQYKGTPDDSFMRGPGGPPPGGGFGGFGGPGGGQGGGRPGGGPGGPGGFPGGGPGGPGFGPPPGMIPGAILGDYLSLTESQKAKLARLIKAFDSVRQENFAPDAFPKLKLTEEQIGKLADGQKLRSVLTPEQVRTLEANPRRFPGGGPGGPGGGPGGFEGPPPV